jgi:DNA-binding CsgD family transcriptional regulator
MIGRETELEALEHLLAEAADGSGRVALITSSDGMGRSRLLTEFISRASRRQACLWQVTAWPGDILRPYATLLRLCEHAQVGDPTSAAADALQRAVARMTGLVAASPVRDIFACATPLDPGKDPRHSCMVVLDALRQLATSEPVVIALDDAHLADEITWAFLRALAPLVARLPLLLVLTYRDEPAPPEGLLLALDQLSRQTAPTRLPLAPLTPAETAAMVRALLPPEDSLAPAVEAALSAVTRGHPYAIERALAAMRARQTSPMPATSSTDGHIPDAGEAYLPQSAREAVRWSLARLSPPARAALIELAITIADPPMGLSEADAAKNWPGTAEERHELLAAGLIAQTTGFAPIRLAPHALTCESVLANLTRDERQRAHHAAAEDLVARLAHLEAPQRAEMLPALAEHAVAAGDWELALTHACQAGEHALALAAPRAAVLLFTLALEAAAILERAAPGFLCDRAEAYRQLDDFERAHTDAAAALTLARETSDRPAEWRALHDQGVLWMGRDYTRSGQCFERSYTVARALGEPTALVASLNRLGIWHLNMDRPHDAMREHRKALAILRANERMADAGETLYFLGLSSLTGGDPGQAASFYAQAIPLLREGTHQQRLSSSLATLALCGLAYQTELLVFVPSDQLDSVRYAESALATARQIGWRSGEAYALLCLASCLGPRGEYARALKAAHQSLRIAEEIEHTQWTVAALWTLGTLYRALMVLTEAARYFEQSWALAREIGSWHWQRVTAGHLATLYMVEGDFARAEALLDAAQVVETPPSSLGQLCVACARVDLALARGESQQALDMVDALLAHPPESLPARPISRLARQRGEALAALGRRAEAEATLRAARQEAATQGERDAQWYLDVALARLLHGQGRDIEATRAAQSARTLIEAVAERLPEAGLSEPFRQRALRMLPPTSSPASRRALKETFNGLTAREREVAALIAQGKSNRAIAEALVVSERTAETHVGNILNKLHFSSRAQIATWAAEKLQAISEEEREEAQ